MATYFSPQIVPVQWQVAGEPAASFVLHAFDTGASTSAKTMFTDNAGTSAGTSITLDSEGYLSTSGTRHPLWLDVGVIYRLELRDATDVTVVWKADDVDALGGGNRPTINHDTVADMVADTSLVIGDLVFTKGYLTSGDGGGNDYDIVAASTGTDDGGEFIDLATHQAQAIFSGKVYRAKQFGTTGGNSADDTTELQALLSTTAKHIILNSGDNYKISAALTTAVADRTIWAYGATISPTSDLTGTQYCINNTASRVKILGLKVAGVASTTLCGGIGLTTGDAAQVANCSFTDLDNGGGIVASSAAVAHDLSRNFFSNVAALGLGGLQFGAIHCNASKSVISENRMIGCPQTGVSTSNPDAINIGNNYIDGTNTTASGGIVLDQSGSSCNISNNIIKDVRVEGIQIANSVAGQASEDHTVSANTIVSTRAADDGPVSGITAIASGTGTVERININGNTIRTDDRDGTSQIKGIDLDACIDTNVSGNTIEGGWVGIGFSSTSIGTNIVGNTLRNQNTTAISLTGGGRECLIQGNKIVGDGAAGSTTGITFNGATGGGEQHVMGNFINDCLVGITSTFSGSQRSFIKSNFFLRNGTDLSLTSNTVNSIGENVYNVARSGEATLVAGAVNVSTSALTANDRIELSLKTPGGTVGSPHVTTRSDGVSFTITSTSGSDTSVIFWELNG